MDALIEAAKRGIRRVFFPEELTRTQQGDRKSARKNKESSPNKGGTKQQVTTNSKRVIVQEKNGHFEVWTDTGEIIVSRVRRRDALRFAKAKGYVISHDKEKSGAKAGSEARRTNGARPAV